MGLLYLWSEGREYLTGQVGTLSRPVERPLQERPRAEPFYAKCGFKPSSVRSTPHGPVSVMSRSLVF